MPALPPQVVMKTTHEILFSLLIIICGYLQEDRGKGEKAMAPHSSTVAWKIPWMEEPGRLQSMGSLRVGYD